MKKMLLAAASAAVLLVPAAAGAQAVPAAVIAVVDLEKVTTDCTACKTATASLRGKQTALQTRAKALSTPLETEQKSLAERLADPAIYQDRGVDVKALNLRIEAIEAELTRLLARWEELEAKK